VSRGSRRVRNHVLSNSIYEEEKRMKHKKEEKTMKKLYASPKLLEYGAVSKLTQGGGSSGTDAGSMMATGPGAAPGGAPLNR
jgi:hypothetical protein